MHPLKKSRYSGRQFLYSFTSLRPTVEDDLLVCYDGSAEPLPAEMETESLFGALDGADLGILSRNDLPVLDKSDFSTPSPGWTWMLAGAAVVGVLFWVGLFYGLYRWVKRSRSRSRRNEA